MMSPGDTHPAEPPPVRFQPDLGRLNAAGGRSLDRKWIGTNVMRRHHADEILAYAGLLQRHQTFDGRIEARAGGVNTLDNEQLVEAGLCQSDDAVIGDDVPRECRDGEALGRSRQGPQQEQQNSTHTPVLSAAAGYWLGALTPFRRSQSPGGRRTTAPPG